MLSTLNINHTICLEPLETLSNTTIMKNLTYSRQNFLENLQNATTVNAPEPEDVKKKRKISFKVKSSVSQNKRITLNNSTTLSPSKVQQLTSKFNELMHEQPKMARAIRRVNSTKLDLNKKPSIRPKPNKSDDKKRPSVKRKTSVKQITKELDERIQLKTKTESTDINRTRNSVRETIEIFERRKSELLPTNKLQKPKVPEKNVNKTKDIVVKDGIRKFKILACEKSKTNLVELQNYFENKTCSSENTDKSKNVIDISEIDHKSEINYDENILENTVKNDNIVFDNKNLSKSNKMSLYDILKVPRTISSAHLLKIASGEKCIQPNNSFLYRSRSKDSSFNIYTSIEYEDQKEETKTETEYIENVYEDTGQENIPENNIKDENIDNLYDTVEIKPEISDEEEKYKYEKLLAKTDEILKDYKKLKTEEEKSTEKSEEDNISNHSYEIFDSSNQYGSQENVENIYETLSLKTEPAINENIYTELPTHHFSNSSLNHLQNELTTFNGRVSEDDLYAVVKNPYEKIVHPMSNGENNDQNLNYESISLISIFRNDDSSICGSNRNSILSYDQQSNSLYGKYSPKSENSFSDRSNSDDWIDISDIEDEVPGFVVIREKQNKKKNSNWSHKVRDQWSKSPKKVIVLENDALSDTNHFYESLNSDDDFDSFDSESDDESFTKINYNDSGVDLGLSQLPEPPRDDQMSSGNIYGLTRFAARLRKNWSLTKNDITKSLSRMTKKKLPLSENVRKVPPPRPPPPVPPPKLPSPVVPPPEEDVKVEIDQKKPEEDIKSVQKNVNANSLTRKKNWLKFRRAVSMGETSSEEPGLQIYNQNKSVFYLANDKEGDKQQQNFRRRTSRPQSPPPPVPTTASITPTKTQKARSTSWYAECGLFKQTDASTMTDNHDKNENRTCWYAEIGLYQPKRDLNNPSSSRENSGDSPLQFNNKLSYSKCLVIDNNNKNLNKPDLILSSKFYTNLDLDNYYNVKNQNYYNFDGKKNPQIDKMSNLLKEEPLYQFYDAAVAEKALNESSSDSEYDGYEEIGDLTKLDAEDHRKEEKRTSVRKLQGFRTLWCEIPEVIHSEILRTLTTMQKKLQEAKFEIITSEISYLNSLNVLTDHFIPALNDYLFEEDRKILFGNMFDVKNCSEALLTDLELCWEHSILLPGICDIIQKHCKKNFHVYIEYCANQSLSDAVLRKLKGDMNPRAGKSPNLTRFGEAIRNLEASVVCQGLSLHSFLMLPMQRVTRLPLLVDAVLRRLTPADDDFQSCQRALMSLHDLATRCNEAARHTERISELNRLKTQLEFPPGVPDIDLLSEGAKRYLVRSGELTQLLARGSTARGDDAQSLKLTFGKKITKQVITLLLFEDWVVIARKKSDDILTVIHHCPRSFLELSSAESPPTSFDSSLLLFLTLLENQDSRQISLLLSCSSESEKQRWEDVLKPPKAENPNEVIYESWDCPQVQVLHHYESVQPDELNLKRGDVVNVDKKMKDGWFHGERLRDGVKGWFPGNYTIEIANPHVRARNLRQRYRLLAFTDEFLNKTSKP